MQVWLLYTWRQKAVKVVAKNDFSGVVSAAFTTLVLLGNSEYYLYH